ncbi:MAG: hypothetical protein F6K53_44035 [Moorea sp. SIO4A1]|nr:hypothetical protein [Moorena sp. SIO4A1]
MVANSDLACKDASFKSSMFGGFLSINPPAFARLNRTPKNYSTAFPNDCLNPAANGQCWGKPRHQYSARFNNIKEWRGKICARSVQNASNNHVVSYQSSSSPTCPIGGNVYCQQYYGPKVGFQVKYSDNKWRWLKGKNGNLAVYEIPANNTHVYSWAWKTSEPSDFRLVVKYAKPLDEFDFMMDKK